MDVLEAVVVERISSPTRARVAVVAERAFDSADVVGQKGRLSIGDGKAARHFHLVVTSVEALETANGSLAYSIQLSHELALLDLRRDSRAFLSKSAKEIVEAVFVAAGIGATRTWSLARSPATRPWCMQYDETDLAFVMRLLEAEGVFFCVLDDDAASKLQIADGPGAFEPIDAERVPLAHEWEGTGIVDFALEHVLTSDAVTLRDWNFETPGVDLTSSARVTDAPAGERFEWPGGYVTQAAGAALAKVRAEELASGKVTAEGRSDRVAMRAGAWFELTSERDDAPVGRYLLREVEHVVSQQSYENRFVCSPRDLPFRPARVTPAPRLGTTHAAAVAAPRGEEVHTDKHGRAKAKLAFDRSTSEGDEASAWMRVAQPLVAGSMFLARAGWEVAIRYLEGDPDRPIVCARLFDGAHPPPRSLPAEQAMTVFETLSSPRGEKRSTIAIQDKSGEMQLSMEAAKDFDATVEHDWCETIGGDDAVSIAKDETTVIEGAQTLKVDGDLASTVKKDAGLAIAGDRTRTVRGDEIERTRGSLSTKVAGKQSETVASDRKVETKGAWSEIAKGAYTVNAGGAVRSSAASQYEIFVAGKWTALIGGPRTIAATDGSSTETVGGNRSSTIAGVCVETVSGNRVVSAKKTTSVTVAGAAAITAGGKLQIKAKKVKIQVGGGAALTGGGGTVALTPASASFVGLLTFKGSGGVEIAGALEMLG